MPHRKKVVAWVANHVLPHESAVRAWLARIGTSAADIDDVIQQTYCVLSSLDCIDHIDSGRAYFFASVRSTLLQRLRRDRVVSFHTVTDLQMLDVVDAAPSPEQTVGARRELIRVLDAISSLPPSYREVIELRRLHGLSQKETALRLGTSEKIVENNLARGLKAVLRALETGDYASGKEVSNVAARCVGQN